MDKLREVKETRDNCLLEISRRTPPRNHHEVIMVEAYKRLLGDIEFRLLLAEMSAND